MVDLNLIKKELEKDEGVVYKIYNDHLGYKTLGIGHLVRKTDPEYNLPVGTPISKQTVDQYFFRDLQTAIIETKKLFPNFDLLPQKAQHVLVNMMFNMGFTRLSKFKNMRKAVSVQDWAGVANSMRNSLWFRQVQKSRSHRLVADIESLISPVV